MKIIFGIILNIIIFSLLYFFAIYYVEIDEGVRVVNYLRLIEESILISLKFHIIILPIIFLVSKRKGGK
ncbi:hypothetical protein E5343_12595 [Rodentibacter caecimuris]|uniref:hypothetical protein n=1 Tax=Rodentibacter caecimuris TaxID=1796644 RepID=UPI00109437E4|nr:hypothetical protein [Pasteurella caecimuris]MCR1837453.1 hypothetical protein [Pasteurella caecimuris]MCU0106910.1 hypothetical protein [Pasteurella caecimuris]TGY45688.1 hypothetical protein E5343_12595 [Pasteurella caecimuris]